MNRRTRIGSGTPIRKVNKSRFIMVCVYFRSPCARFSRSSSGSTSPSLRRSARVSTASSWLMASETPSSSARRMSVSWLVCSIVASVLRPMRVTGCSRISASSDGVKFLLYGLLFNTRICPHFIRRNKITAREAARRLSPPSVRGIWGRKLTGTKPIQSPRTPFRVPDKKVGHAAASR